MANDHDFDNVPAGLSPAEERVYVDARVQGLCHEGALEAALGAGRVAQAATVAPDAGRSAHAEAADTGAGCSSQADAAAGDPARLDTVEFKLAHLERAVQELSDVLYRQQQQLDAVLAAHQRLRQQLDDIDGRTEDASPFEIPPHY